MKVVIAEKPSVAREIASYLGATARRDGYIEGAGYQVTWALGHLVSLKEPDEYDPALKKWNLQSLPIIPANFQLKQVGDAGARKQFKTIKKLLSQGSEIICATDAGREGELIFRYILELAQTKRQRSRPVPMTRLWLSSLTETAIGRAFENRKSLSFYDNLSAAARCRSEADWIVGMNATRNYTVRFGNNGILWSVGRVQTPVLALLARRENEIRHFVSLPWFELLTSYREVIFKLRAPRFDKKEKAEQLKQEITGGTLTVERVSSKCEKSLPPQLYDLTALQRDMNRRYGFSAADTLKFAQTLYEKKAITYPRTDSRYLTKDMHREVQTVFAQLQSRRKKDLAPINIKELSTSKRIFDDSRVSDHHAIIVTKKTLAADNSPLGRILEAIETRMIAAFSAPCLKEVTSVDALVKKAKFRARGVRIVDPGWTSLYPKRKNSRSEGADSDYDTQNLPSFHKGESGPHAPFVKEGATRAPKHHTESSLLGMMETAGKLVDDEQIKAALKARGLGTPATRAAIIETLLRRKYVERNKKELQITDLGLYLISLIQDPLLKSPEMTGEWEEKLAHIEQGSFSAQAFMIEVEEFTRELIDQSDALVSPEQLGSCPLCCSPIVEGKRGYGCSKWKEGCQFVLWKEYKGHNISHAEATELLERHLSSESVFLPQLDHTDNEHCVLYLSEEGKVSHLRDPSRFSQGTKTSREPTSSSFSNGKSPALAPCPLCKSAVQETPKSFGCTRWKEGCSFVIWKTIAGKKVTIAMARKLISPGRTQLLKGFKSKAGKKFDARLKLENGQVVFEFER